MNLAFPSQSELPSGQPRGPWRRYPGLVVLLAGLMTGPLAATTVTLYTNDFEVYTEVATSWTDYPDADPTGPEWIISDDETFDPPNPPERQVAGVQVINWQARSGNKALLLRTATEAQIHFPGPRSGSRYQLDFWLWVERGTNNSDRNFYFILRGEGADHNGDDYIAYRSSRNTNDNTIWYFDGVANTPVGGYWSNTFKVHTERGWQHHRMVIRPNELKMDLYLDDMSTPALANIDLARCEIAVPTMLRIINEANTWNDGFFIVDDISFTVDNAVDLTTTFTEGFENYAARTSPGDDADPGAPWITTETDGTGQGRALAPGKIQVVDSTVVPPRTGNKCLKLEGGQRAGVSLAWGAPPLADVEVTWWARVPEAIQSSPTADANLLRMSLYGAENGNNLAGDNALLGYGIRRQGGTNCGGATSLIYYVGTAWLDTGYTFTPNVWEEYRLITHTARGLYTIIKNPNSPNPQVIVDRAPFIGSGITTWVPVFMAAWSSSNGTNHPPVYVDDIRVRSLVSVADPLPTPYTVQFDSGRFTNATLLPLSGPIGAVAVDPRDNSTIVFTVDAPLIGGIYRATKVAPGNWWVDPTPIVTGLDRPSGLAVEANGTLWWTHDFTHSLRRLKWPWSANTPEVVISDFSRPDATEFGLDDDPFDCRIAPPSFNGTLGKPGDLVVMDRGVDSDPWNAFLLVNPATTNLFQTRYANYLYGPTTTDMGSGDLVGMTTLPASGEVVSLCLDGQVTAVNADGIGRAFWPDFYQDPFIPIAPASIATDPLTGRLWIADDLTNEVWSCTPDGTGGRRELSFPLTNPNRPDLQIDFHEPGMVFAPNGAFLVLSDESTINGGGRLIVFHNEPFTIPNFSIVSGTRTPQGVTLTWSPAGTVQYSVQRGTEVANPASFQTIATNLSMTVLSFTDTNPPPVNAFYRVVATP